MDRLQRLFYGNKDYELLHAVLEPSNKSSRSIQGGLVFSVIVYHCDNLDEKYRIKT